MGAKKTKKIQPYYSPERNPDEQNCDLKQELSVKKNNQIPWKNDKKTLENEGTTRQGNIISADSNNTRGRNLPHCMHSGSKVLPDRSYMQCGSP